MKYFNKIIIFSLLIFICNQKTFSQAGMPDPTFGNNGLIILDQSSLSKTSVIQDDGKILVTGGSLIAYFNIWRFNYDGTLDENFGSSGFAGYNLQGNFSGKAMTLQSDGKILITGEYNAQIGNIDAGILRCNSDGSVDSSFGINGLNTLHINKLNYSRGIIVQDDGKIVIAGETTNTSGIEKNTFLARYYAQWHTGSFIWC